MTGVRNVGNIGIGNEDKIIHWNTSWWPMLLLITHLSLPSTSSSSSEHHKNVLSKPDDILWCSATLDYMSNLISLSCHAVLCADTCSTMHANIIDADAIITIGWRNIFSIFFRQKTCKYFYFEKIQSIWALGHSWLSLIIDKSIISKIFRDQDHLIDLMTWTHHSGPTLAGSRTRTGFYIDIDGSNLRINHLRTICSHQMHKFTGNIEQDQ